METNSMKSSKLDTSGVFDSAKATAKEMEFSLPNHSVQIRENGISFLSAKEVPLWSELTLDLQSTSQNEKIHCRGTVVHCSGNKHKGYVVSITFTGVSPDAQERLSHWAQALPSLQPSL